jgi:hypothetical protein
MLTACEPLRTDICALNEHGDSAYGQRVRLSATATFGEHYSFLTDDRCLGVVVDWSETSSFAGSLEAQSLSELVEREEHANGSALRDFSVEVSGVYLRAVVDEPLGPKSRILVDRVYRAEGVRDWSCPDDPRCRIDAR